jgi:choline dehydrogenase-like flavoprotein
MQNTPPKYLYNVTSIPQSGIGNRTAGIYAAHVVGGGSVVNGMFFDRGSRGDYDLWEQLGNPGWGWSGLLPYFRKVRFSRVTF